jgi:hypothetical protein
MLKMKKMFKLMSFVLVMALLVVSTPISANAASVTYLEITRDNAPLRKEAHDEGKIVARCEEGAVLKSTGSFYNYKFRKWHRVEYQGSTYYIYSGNVETHYHEYEELYYGGTTYKYCDCGQVNVVSTVNVSQSNSIAAYAGAAGVAVAVDGPIPVGDIVGAAILLYGACYLATSEFSDAVIDVLEEIDVDEFLDAHENVCSTESFRKVSRLGGTLTYIDNECMDDIQAFFYVMLVGDVYNVYEQNAEELAALYGSYFKDRDKDNPAYWWHFHLGNDHKDKVKGHIFFGTNDYGMYPISLTN